MPALAMPEGEDAPRDLYPGLEPVALLVASVGL